jgi:chromosome segregation ATPase
MDYLQSLVGKDEETIVDAIKEMAENVEKVQVQAKEIDELNNKLEDNKEEIHYLKRKVDQKYDIIEDVENELDKMEQKYEDAKKQLELKEKDINALEMLISEQVEEINILRDNNQSMVSQIGENIRMEKKMKVQEAVIKELSEKVKCETNDELIEITSERDKLLLEVKHLEQENEEKLKTLETIEIENMVLKDKLDKNDEAEEMNELESHFGKIFNCKQCVKTFGSRGNLETHKRNVHGKENEMHLMQLRLHEMDKQLSDQKFNLTLKIYKLKEIEFIKKETCKCIGWCGISHQKHSWKKSPIKEFYSTFQKLTKVSSTDESHSCNICEVNFTNVPELKKHMKTHENLSNVTNLSETEGALNVHQCESCNESFTNAGDFIFHIENTHKTADVNFLQS